MEAGREMRVREQIAADILGRRGEEIAAVLAQRREVAMLIFKAQRAVLDQAELIEQQLAMRVIFLVAEGRDDRAVGLVLVMGIVA